MAWKLVTYVVMLSHKLCFERKEIFECDLFFKKIVHKILSQICIPTGIPLLTGERFTTGQQDCKIQFCFKEALFCHWNSCQRSTRTQVWASGVAAQIVLGFRSAQMTAVRCYIGLYRGIISFFAEECVSTADTDHNSESVDYVLLNNSFQGYWNICLKRNTY